MGEVNKVFNAEADDIPKNFSKLRVRDRNGNKFILGEIDLFDVNETLVDTYSIEIHSTNAFPYSFPRLFETGCKIPRNIDWHVFEDTGHCCIKVIQEEAIICKNGITLLEFINVQVIPYLFNQTFRRVNGYFLNERGHGIKGVTEFYSSLLKTVDFAKIIELLVFIEKGQEPNRVSPCFCGKSEKYRKCHRDAFRTLSKISNEQLKDDIDLFSYFTSSIRKNYSI